MPKGTASATLEGLARKVREARPPIFGKPGERNALLYWAGCRAIPGEIIENLSYVRPVDPFNG